MSLKAMGTLLARYDGAAFTTVAGVKSISGPGFSADVADVTTLAAASGYEEALPTVLRSGEITVSVSWVPDDTGHLAILADFAAGTVQNYQIQFQDTGVTNYQMACYVVGVSITLETTSVVEAELTLKPTGVPDFDAV
jgi:predicted secreted protein